MVIIYKVLVRFKSVRGHEYSDLNYFLSRSEAYLAAKRYMERKHEYCSADRCIVQEIQISQNGAYIRDTHYTE